MFPRAGDAVKAGVALLRGLDAARWPEDPPRVCVGIHTGEAERWRSGYIGNALVRTLAVCAEAPPNSVVLSPATESLIDSDALQAIDIRTLGRRTVPWFDRPVELFEASSRDA